MSLFRRAPDAQVTVEAGEPKDDMDAILRCTRFNSIFTTSGLSLVGVDGRRMTLKGRPRDVDAFMAKHASLAAMDLV